MASGSYFTPVQSLLFLMLLLVPTGLWTAGHSRAPARAPDLILPGHKPVRHELVLDWPESLDAYRFVLSPTRGFHGNHVVEKGVPFRFSTKYGARIWALPADAPLPDKRKYIEPDRPWPNVRTPVRETKSIALGHPLAHIVTKFRIVAVDDKTLRFERIGESRFDASGRALGRFDWLPLLVIGICGALWLLAIDRRRQQSETAV